MHILPLPRYWLTLATYNLYPIEKSCLNQAERRRLDGFQNYCLRRICRVSPSYISRVSNRAVLQICQQTPLSHSLARRQMLYMGHLARRPDEDPVRSSVFEPGGLVLKSLLGKRRRGRPRQSWGPMVLKNCLNVAGSHERLADYFRREGGAARRWEQAVKAWAAC